MVQLAPTRLLICSGSMPQHTRRKPYSVSDQALRTLPIILAVAFMMALPEAFVVTLLVTPKGILLASLEEALTGTPK